MAIKTITRTASCLSLVLLISACSSSNDAVEPADDATGNNNIVNDTEVGTDTSTGSGTTDSASETSTGGSEENIDSGTGTGGIDDDNDSGTSTGGTDDDNDSGTDAEEVVFEENHFIFGSVSIDAYNVDTTYISAVFADFNQTIPADIIDEELRQPRTQDRCEAESDDGTVAFGEPYDFQINGTLAQFISAGEVLTISSPNGTFTELHRQYDDEFLSYSIDDSVETQTVPNGMRVTIPGDVYPGFSDVAIPDIEILQLTSNQNLNDFTRDSSLTWIASNNPNSQVYLDAYVDNLYITCSLVDDGEFSLPEGLKALIETDDKTYINVERRAHTFVEQDNVVLSVFTYSGPSIQ